MKNYSTYQKAFFLTSLLLSFLFFYTLYGKIASQEFRQLGIIASVYGVSMFIAGLFWGYLDRVRNSRKDIGFTFHFITYLNVNFSSIVWMFIFLNFSMQNFLLSMLNLIIWGFLLWLHYQYSKRSIKGYHQQNIF
jgi:predicted MFS family arabinose efflux permease